MMPRSVSATASTITWRTPSAASLSSAARKVAEPACTCFSAHEPDLVRGLPRQHAHQARIGHRVERVVAHVRIGQQQVADEQMAEEDGAAVLGEGRTVDRLLAAQRVEQRIADRADVALVRRIECRAVLEEEADAARRLQGLQRLSRLGDRVLRRDRARLERDDDGIDVVGDRALRRHADGLDGAHAALDQHARDVGRTGEVVGDDSENGHGGR